jgi:hypothetical protein
VADRKRVRLRWLPFPSGREDQPPPEPMPPVTGRDGFMRGGDYIRKSLGLPSAPAADPDYGVTWTPWPPS